jgi:hypothetical protein
MVLADDFNPSIFVSESSDEVVVKHVLSNLQDVNRQYPPARETLLIAAVSDGRIELARFLLENGADPDISGWGGISALRLAAGNGNHRLVKLLLDFNADPNMRTNHLEPAIICTVCELNFSSAHNRNYNENALKVIDLLAPKTSIEKSDLSLPARVIQREENPELKLQQIKLLEIIKNRCYVPQKKSEQF